jgi:MFS family permease
MFLALNLLNGLCRSFYEPVSQALMADLTPREKRFRVFSLRYLCINIGVSVGPLLGALFGMMSGRLPFIITGSIYLFYAIVLYALLRRFGIRDIEGDKKEQVSIGSAWRVIRKDTVFRWYLAGGVMGGISYSQMGVTLSQYIELKGLNEGVNLFAVLMSINAIVVVLLQVPLSRWMEKHKPIVSIALGSGMYVLGNLGYAAADGWVLFVAAMIVFTLGEILTFPSTNLLIDGLAPEGLRGTYYGAQSFNNLGHFLGPFIGGWMLDAWNGTVLFTLMAAVPVFGAGFYSYGQKIFQRKKMFTNL